MRKYEAWHRLESERVLRAMTEWDLEAVCVGADGWRTPFGQFLERDLRYWAEFHEDAAQLAQMLIELAGWGASQLEAGGWSTLDEAPTAIRAEAVRREQPVIAEIERLGPIDDDAKVVNGRLFLKVQPLTAIPA